MHFPSLLQNKVAWLLPHTRSLRSVQAQFHCPLLKLGCFTLIKVIQSYIYFATALLHRNSGVREVSNCTIPCVIFQWDF
jgi:hypothetical protein